MELSAQLEESIDMLSSLATKMPNRIRLIEQQLSLCDQEISDIHHLIELTRLNASDGYKTYRDLQITLVKRRELKDELGILVSLRERMQKKDVLGTHASSLKTSFEQRKQNKSARTYGVKVRTDLVGRDKGMVTR